MSVQDTLEAPTIDDLSIPQHTSANERPDVVLAHGAGGCSCGCGGKGDACSCGGTPAPSPPPSFVFALGTVAVRFPDPALEHELNALADMLGIEGQANSTTRIYDILVTKEARYIARQLCYIFSVEGQPIYVLKIRDASDLELLIEAIKPRRQVDLSLVIGVRGPMAPREMCGGMELPIVVIDQLTSFKRDDLIARIPVPDETDPDAFRDTVESVFDRLVQATDNVGATDAHRALNFVATRYAPLYAQVAAMERRGAQLSAVEVQVSGLSSTRKLMEVILVFQSRNNGFIDKFFVRVDVTSEFPMIATHLQPYFDR